MFSNPDPRYPIGEFVAPLGLDRAARSEWIAQIEEAPHHLRHALHGLTAVQLDTPYREGGWTIRQVAHHLPDSHVNAYVRYKLALTEDTPTIRPYSESRWAELEDAQTAAADLSLALLEAVHRKWLDAIRRTPEAGFERCFFHPELASNVSLHQQLALYAWHGRHHVAHITSLREQRGW